MKKIIQSASQSPAEIKQPHCHKIERTSLPAMKHRSACPERQGQRWLSCLSSHIPEIWLGNFFRVAPEEEKLIWQVRAAHNVRQVKINMKDVARQGELLPVNVEYRE